MSSASGGHRVARRMERDRLWRRNRTPFAKSLKYALAGVTTTFARESNMRRHFWLCQLLFVYLLITRPSLAWVALSLIAAAAVFAAELLNTAIEHVVDLVQPLGHPVAKRAKDAAAGGVLAVACGALCVAAALVRATYPWRFQLFTRNHLMGAVIVVAADIMLWTSRFRSLPEREEES